MSAPILIATFAIAALFSYVLVGWVKRWAVKRHLLDMPNGRSSHSIPTPHGGGFGIVVTTVISVVAGWFVFQPNFPVVSMLAYLIPAITIAMISWYDDMSPISNKLRFMFHSVAAIISMLFIGTLQEIQIPFYGMLNLHLLGIPLTFLWIVGPTNAYNFMDGIDGIAGTQAAVAGIGWIVIGQIASSPFITLFGLAIASSSLGFLGHNWMPARIFMGDVGSTFLGYTFAILPLIATTTTSVPYAFVAGFLFFWAFLTDTSFTFFRRLCNGENVFSAHRSHVYQRLVTSGYSHATVTLVYGGLASVGLILASLLVVS